MDESFIGEYTQRVDGKGRMSIPAGFRRVLEAGDPKFPDTPLPRIVVLYGPHLKNCLHAYTVEAMAEIQKEIKSLPRGSQRRKRVSRMILSKAWQTEIDRDGRIVLPKERREQIGLQGECVMAGMADYFEIWNKDTYDAKERAEIDGFLEDMPEDYDPLSDLDDGAEG